MITRLPLGSRARLAHLGLLCASTLAPIAAYADGAASHRDESTSRGSVSSARAEFSFGLFVTGETEVYPDRGLREAGLALALRTARADRWVFLDARARRSEVHPEGKETFELGTSTQWIVPLALGIRQNLADPDGRTDWPFRIYGSLGIQMAWVHLTPPPELTGLGGESSWSGGAFLELRPEVNLSRTVSLFLATRASALTPVDQALAGEVTLGGVDAQLGAALTLH
jgi:hypothetical protein